MIEKGRRGDGMPPDASRIVSSKDAPTPIGPYSQGIVTGDLVFCSGQIGLDPTTGLIVPGGASKEAERALLNMKAVLEAAGTGLNEVVKVTLYLKNMGDFSDVNEVYAKHFGESKPARSTVEVSALPRGALVEIEAVARVP
jgi:2-iminobutanoate/2-iminopropanoate deaminase